MNDAHARRHATFLRVPLTVKLELSALLPDAPTATETCATLKQGADLRAELSRILHRCLPVGAQAESVENDEQLDKLCHAVSEIIWPLWTANCEKRVGDGGLPRSAQLAARYKRMHVKYAPTTGKLKLGHAYEALVVGAGGKYFDRLLAKEEEMVAASRALQSNRDDELRLLAERHARELELVGASDRRRGNLPDVKRTQADEVHVCRTNWESQLEALYRRQKVEHNAFVFALYREMTEGIAVPKPDTQPVEAPPAPINIETKEEVKPVRDPELASMMSSLTEMGFTEKQAVGALSLSKRQLDRAIIMLLEQPETVAKHNAALERQQSSGGSSQLSTNDSSVPSSPSERGRSPSNNWKAIGFLEEKLAKSQARSNLKKMSSWLDKAKAQIEDILEPENAKQQQLATPVNTDHMVESFTITVGAQVRRVHNLRLLVGRMDGQLSAGVSPPELAAMHAQTSATLYSRVLNGIVMLADLNAIAQYRLGYGTSKALFIASQKQCELHFPDYDTQMNGIEHAWSDNTLAPAEGDIFMTRHSNIPGVHVIFHLCVDFSALKSDINQRSPLVHGLRNVLMVAHRFEVKHLTLPLLLLPDTAPESSVVAPAANTSRTSLLPSLHRSGSNSSLQQDPAESFTDAFLSKRGEMILKSVKGMLLELSRSYGKHGETRHGANSADDQQADSNTIQFVLPPWLAKEATFETMRNLLRSIYRTV